MDRKWPGIGQGHVAMHSLALYYAICATILLSFALAEPARASDEVTEFRLPTSPSNASAITAGPNNSMWFGVERGQPDLHSYDQHFTPEIDRILPSGEVVTVSVVPQAASAITAGPDNNMWFFGLRNNIGRITSDGQVTEFPLPTDGAFLEAITAGPEGNLWGHVPQLL